MTVVARNVLNDCRAALAELRADPVGQQWMLRWVATVALLRTVGAALKKVDSSSDPELANIIERHWQVLNSEKPEPRIFWEFIDDERNNVLKEYRLVAGVNVSVFPGNPPEPAKYEYVMNRGPYKGIDQRVLVGEAIEWWDQHLSSIEAEFSGMDD